MLPCAFAHGTAYRIASKRAVCPHTVCSHAVALPHPVTHARTATRPLRADFLFRGMFGTLTVECSQAGQSYNQFSSSSSYIGRVFALDMYQRSATPLVGKVPSNYKQLFEEARGYFTGSGVKRQQGDDTQGGLHYAWDIADRRCWNCRSDHYSDSPGTPCRECPRGKFIPDPPRVSVDNCTSCPANSEPFPPPRPFSEGYSTFGGCMHSSCESYGFGDPPRGCICESGCLMLLLPLVRCCHGSRRTHRLTEAQYAPFNHALPPDHHQFLQGLEPRDSESSPLQSSIQKKNGAGKTPGVGHVHAEVVQRRLIAQPVRPDTTGRTGRNGLDKISNQHLHTDVSDVQSASRAFMPTRQLAPPVCSARQAWFHPLGTITATAQ